MKMSQRQSWMALGGLVAGLSRDLRVRWSGRIGVVSAILLAVMVVGTTGTVNAAAQRDALGTAQRSTAVAASSTSSGSEFGPTFFGVNDAYSGLEAFSDDENFSSQLAQLAPGTLRWPGGTGADYFDWHTGMPTTGSHSFDFTLQDLEAHYRATGAAPIFDLNVLTPANITNPSDQIQMLQQAQSLGLPIKYVEIGNELYFNGTNNDFVHAYPTGTDYGQTVAIYVKALHQAFPGVQVSAVAAVNQTPGSTARQQTWNAEMMAAAAQAGGSPDVVTLHIYPGPNIDGFTGSSDQLNTLFEGAYQAITDLDAAANSAALSGKPLWITEYNMAYSKEFEPNPEQLTYAHEVYLAALALMLPRVDDAALVNSWEAFAGNQLFGAWDDPSNPTLSPYGQALEWVDRAAYLRDSTETITFPGAPTLPNGDPEIMGQAFTSPGRSPHSVIVNLSSSQQQVAVGGDIPSGAPYKQASGTPGDAESVAPTPTTGTVGTRTLTLPPYSVTQIGDVVFDDLQDLQNDVQGVGPGTSLSDKVALAQSEVAAADTPDTCDTLGGFINEVQGQTGVSIPTAQAAQLIAGAQRIEVLTGC